MTNRIASDRIASPYSVVPVLVATFCLAACEAFVGGMDQTPPPQPTQPTVNEPTAPNVPPANDPPPVTMMDPKPTNPPPNNDDDKDDDKPPMVMPPGGSTPTPSADVCATAPLKAQTMLTNYCGNCHGDVAQPKAGFNTVLNVKALVMSGKIVKEDADASPLFKRLANNSMPPSDVAKRPSTGDIASLKEWIECGAQDWVEDTGKAPVFVDIDTRLNLMLDDLRSISNPIDREDVRYIDLTSLANSGISSSQLQVYREAVSFLVNSLSRGRSVVEPKAIDKDKLLYRIELEDYLWDEETWNQLEDIYPYAVIYDQDSRLYPFDEATAEQIREETNTNIPYIQGDWFISHAARPPLYHTLLDLPDTLQGLEQDLGIDIEENIADESVLRSGFANAGPSQNNRVIERHELDGNVGALWLSYDFSNNLNDKNIFANPLDFEEDGGEMIFNLENGLQAYFVADAAGNRLDKAPTNVVQDPASRDGAVENGLSCMNCHQTNGQLPKYDEIRDFQLNAGNNAEEIEQVLAIYVPREELQAAFDADQNRYRSARAAINVTKVTDTTMHALDDAHLGVIDLNGVASVVGLKSADLQRSIDASPQAFPAEIVTLRTRGGGIQRDAFEEIFDELLLALGLGESLQVDANGNAVDVDIDVDNVDEDNVDEDNVDEIDANNDNNN